MLHKRLEMGPPGMRITPAQAAMYGLVAGFIGTALLSALSRIPGIRQAEEAGNPMVPSRNAEPSMSPVTPEGALAKSHGPGPEGAAGLFAEKVGSGMFGRDIRGQARGWGKLVHFLYGSFWGLLYAISQPRHLRRPLAAGTAHGLAAWTVGPGFLVPAMKLSPPPHKARPAATLISIAGHVIYGVVIASLFNRLTRGRSSYATAD
jgi:hypothetical protein